MAGVDGLVEQAAAGEAAPVYLVAGDLVLAEPAARRLAEALAQAAGCEVEVRRRPPRLGPVLADLKTYSLFAPAKVILAVDTALLADRAAAAELVDAAAAALPLPEGRGELAPPAREAASRLLQALRLFDLDPFRADPAEVVAALPDWALAGGGAVRRKKPRGRPAGQIRELREGLARLLEAARQAELTGWAEGDLAELGDAVREGLPRGHSLVLAEGAVAADHPLVAALAAAGRVVEVGRVESERGRWQGLGALAGELERETGVGIAPAALEELARRTLRGGRGPREGAEADSTARLAGEYRKLANLAPGGVIELAMVEEAVADRGQEDVWGVLDAIGAGKAAEALDRLGRLLAAAADPVAARLSFFALLASFCRHLVAVRGMMALTRVPAGEGSYPRFKARHAPALQGELPGGGKNPLAGLHPFRLHRAYLAAGRWPGPDLAALPAAVLAAELELKGESTDPDAALAALVARLATAGRRAQA